MKPSIRASRSLSASSIAIASLFAANAGCLGVGDAASVFGDGGGARESGGETTGSSGGPAASTSTSAGGAPGANAGSEDCLDGVDDDHDGLVDCADPDCQSGFECIDADPDGWEGHYYVHETTLVGEAAPACPAELERTSDYTGALAPAECFACTCGGLEGAACAAADLTCWEGSAACQGALETDPTHALRDGECHDQAISNLLALSCAMTAPATLTAPGGCAPSHAALTHPSPWGERIDACGTKRAGGGCGAGAVCAPKGSGDAGESLCLRREGQSDCPSNWSTKVTAYEGAVDTRACSPCSCDASGVGCDAGGYTFFDLDACATAGESSPPIAIATTCTDVTPLLDQGTWSVKATLPEPSGHCVPHGGEASGSAAPKSSVTYCCK